MEHARRAGVTSEGPSVYASKEIFVEFFVPV